MNDPDRSIRLPHFIYGKLISDREHHDTVYRTWVAHPKSHLDYFESSIVPQIRALLADITADSIPYSTPFTLFYAGEDYWHYVKVFPRFLDHDGEMLEPSFHCVLLENDDLHKLQWQPWMMDDYMAYVISEHGVHSIHGEEWAGFYNQQCQEHMLEVPLENIPVVQHSTKIESLADILSNQGLSVVKKIKFIPQSPEEAAEKNSLLRALSAYLLQKHCYGVTIPQFGVGFDFPRSKVDGAHISLPGISLLSVGLGEGSDPYSDWATISTGQDGVEIEKEPAPEPEAELPEETEPHPDSEAETVVKNNAPLEILLEGDDINREWQELNDIFLEEKTVNDAFSQEKPRREGPPKSSAPERRVIRRLEDALATEKRKRHRWFTTAIVLFAGLLALLAYSYGGNTHGLKLPFLEQADNGSVLEPSPGQANAAALATEDALRAELSDMRDSLERTQELLFIAESVPFNVALEPAPSMDDSLVQVVSTLEQQVQTERQEISRLIGRVASLTGRNEQLAAVNQQLRSSTVLRPQDDNQWDYGAPNTLSTDFHFCVDPERICTSRVCTFRMIENNNTSGAPITDFKLYDTDQPTRDALILLLKTANLANNNYVRGTQINDIVCSQPYFSANR